MNETLGHLQKLPPLRDIEDAYVVKNLGITVFSAGELRERFRAAIAQPAIRKSEEPEPQKPIDVVCDACFAKPGKVCSQPTNVGRRDVAWFHLSREQTARGW